MEVFTRAGLAKPLAHLRLTRENALGSSRVFALRAPVPHRRLLSPSED